MFEVDYGGKGDGRFSFGALVGCILFFFFFSPSSYPCRVLYCIILYSSVSLVFLYVYSLFYFGAGGSGLMLSYG